MKGTTTCSCSRLQTTCCSCTPSTRRMVHAVHSRPWASCCQCCAPFCAGSAVVSSLGVVDFLNNYQQLLRTNCDMFASGKRLTASGEALHKCAVCPHAPSPILCHWCSPSVQMHCQCTTGWSATFWSGVMQNCRLNYERERYTHCHCRCAPGVCASLHLCCCPPGPLHCQEWQSGVLSEESCHYFHWGWSLCTACCSHMWPILV